MTCIRFWPAALLAVVLVASLRADEGKGDENEPTLLGLIRKRLEKIPELQPDKGVRVAKASYSRGVIRITGTVKSSEQRDRILREVEAMRREIESTLDLKVREIDVSGLAGAVGPRPEKEKERPGRLPPPLPGTQQQAKPVQDGAHIVWSVVVCYSSWGCAPPVAWYPPHYSCGPFPPYPLAPAYPAAVHYPVWTVPAPGWVVPFDYYP